MSKIDCHIHSCFSDDGQYYPDEIIQMAKEANMKVISIADHDTTEAYAHFDYQNIEGLEVVTGVELDCVIDKINLHVLGFGIDPQDEAFVQISQNIIKQEKNVGKKRIELVKQLGICLDEEWIIKAAKGKTITGELIAEAALMDERNADNPLLAPYRAHGSRSDNPLVNFYWDICAPTKPAYVPVEFISLKEAVNIIHQSGGIAVLAHPGNNIHEDEALLDKIIQEGVEGIEVYSSYHNASQIEFYHQKALDYRCLITCGSDFHGKIKPAIKIGNAKPKESDEALIDALKKAIEKRKQLISGSTR